MISLDKLKANAAKAGIVRGNTSLDIYSGDKLVKSLRGHACGSSLGGHSAAYKDVDYFVYLLNSRYNGAGNLSSTYLSWLIKDSPLAECFIEIKTAKKALEYGFVIIDADKPANLMQAAMQATRMMWEYPELVNSFECLHKMFTRKTKALRNFLFCVSIFLYKKSISDLHPVGHSFIPYTLYKDFVVNFCKDTKLTLNNTYKSGCGYRGVDNLFQKKLDGKLAGTIFVNIARTLVADGVKSSNPFAAAKVGNERGNIVTIPDNKLVEFVNTSFKEFGLDK